MGISNLDVSMQQMVATLEEVIKDKCGLVVS